MIVPRAEWRAHLSSLPGELMVLPARALFLHHTVTDVTMKPYVDMRQIEEVGLDRFGQFPYSYCVHPDGTIMEGCGLRRGAHTKGRNSTSFGVALIGNYDVRNVTAFQLDAVRRLIAYLIATVALRPGTFPTGGHRDVSPTACPGDKAYRLLDAMRIPWEVPISMADNPDLANMEGPLSFHPISDSAGTVKGYYIFSTATGELHTYSAEGERIPYLGRSEDPTP